eukprot:6184539-Pleurochrysis_carterae.AAC.2
MTEALSISGRRRCFLEWKAKSQLHAHANRTTRVHVSSLQSQALLSGKTYSKANVPGAVNFAKRSVQLLPESIVLQTTCSREAGAVHHSQALCYKGMRMHLLPDNVQTLLYDPRNHPETLSLVLSPSYMCLVCVIAEKFADHKFRAVAGGAAVRLDYEPHIPHRYLRVDRGAAFATSSTTLHRLAPTPRASDSLSNRGGQFSQCIWARETTQNVPACIPSNRIVPCRTRKSEVLEVCRCNSALVAVLGLYQFAFGTRVYPKRLATARCRTPSAGTDSATKVHWRRYKHIVQDNVRIAVCVPGLR